MGLDLVQKTTNKWNMKHNQPKENDAYTGFKYGDSKRKAFDDPMVSWGSSTAAAKLWH